MTGRGRILPPRSAARAREEKIRALEAELAEHREHCADDYNLVRAERDALIQQNVSLRELYQTTVARVAGLETKLQAAEKYIDTFEAAAFETESEEWVPEAHTKKEAPR